MNPVGQWLVDNVVSDNLDPNDDSDKGIWCTNCHTQLGQELWKAEDVTSLVHAQPGDPGHVREPFPGATLADVASGIGVTLAQAEAWLDPKTTEDMVAVWQSDPGMCDYVSGLFGGPVSSFQDGGVATIEVNLNDGDSCSTGAGAPGPNCGGEGPAFYICLKTGTGPGGMLDADGDVNVNLLDFCTTGNCVAAAQANLDINAGQAAVPVPFSAATDGRDHWLSAVNHTVRTAMQRHSLSRAVTSMLSRRSTTRRRLRCSAIHAATRTSPARVATSQPTASIR